MAFPSLNFPQYSTINELNGKSRQYLEPRINDASAGSFSAASIDDDGQLTFLRNVRGRYVNYHTPCLPLTTPNICTPYDGSGVTMVPSVMSQMMYFQWNYKDVYIPSHLLYGMLTESIEQQQNVDYLPMSCSTVAKLSYSQCTCLFYASGPLLETLTCGVISLTNSHHSLDLNEYSSLQMPATILEIQAIRTQGKEFLCVRSSYYVSFIEGPSEDDLCTLLKDNVEGLGSKVMPQLMTPLALFHTDYCIASVIISPYIAGEGVVVMETGGIYLWRRGQQLQVLQQPLTTPTASSPSHFWQCCYGSHPQSIVLAEHCGVSLGDFRCSKLIFSLMMSSSDLPHNTLISSVTPSSTNSHHHIYITTTHSLMLIDIRQPQYTLLQLSHDLNHTPKIMDTISYSVNGDMCECVMLCDCVSGDSMIFTMATTNPPTINASPHTVAKYSELENLWQGKSALPLLGNRLRLPLVGASLFTLNMSENEILFAAVNMSVIGDLFYQIWSYCETPPTATPTATLYDDSWLQEALLQEQDIKMSEEEWHVSMATVNFNPLLTYLADNTQQLCLPCWSMMTSSETTPPTSSEATHPHYRCIICGGRLTPLKTRKVAQKLVMEGLTEETLTTHRVTMATGMERLRASCDLRFKDFDSNHDDQMFCDGWMEGDDMKQEPSSDDESASLPEATPTRSHTNTPTKTYTPKSRNKQMGF